MVDCPPVIEALFRERPTFHGHGGEVNWQVGDDLVRWIMAAVPSEARVLETGAGYSTIAFLAAGARVTSVAPDADELSRIAAWAGAHGLDTDGLEPIAERSDSALPTMASERAGGYDIALVDGDHCFPIPALDAYYGSIMLRRGGTLLIDDVEIRACQEVADFHAADPDRWRRYDDVGSVARFEKLGDFTVTDGVWRSQPWNRPTRESWIGRLAAAVGRTFADASESIRRRSAVESR